MTIEFYARTKNGWVVRTPLKIWQFPGGEWGIKREDETDYAIHYAVMRGADMNDIAKLALWSELLKNEIRYTFIPYLPAARADKGEPGAQVYFHLINAAVRAGQIYCVDPHSVRAESYYWNPSKLDVARIVARTVLKDERRPDEHKPYVAVIAPDKGAHARAKAVGDLLGVPTFYAGKERDFETGKLSKFTPPEGWDDRWSRFRGEASFLVVDDICDGGGTFMGLASVLGLPKERLDLWVTHGVFSGNAAQLRNSYGTIYTTDSHPGASNKEVGARVHALLPDLLEEIGF